MDDVKQLMRHNYLTYASYVILDRAIPNVIDGLKPVQRRIMHTLSLMHDGKLHKVANAAGQVMAFHPHGDAAIMDALIHMSNKGYLLDQQGNFGNIFTGDPAAAARYIETRLSQIAVETMFNPDLTEKILSYDGRAYEPICLPAKIPVVLLHGAEGIAVGMSTTILPHNFNELLEAEIAILEGREYQIFPDFITAGLMDASLYDKGKGKIKLRAKVEIRDAKTIVITEICYGTTTESLIRSIDEAAKRGKIKIDAINDYTSEKIEIEVKLPRGQYAQDLIDALYVYTECEVTHHSQIIVIKDNLPWEPNVNQILELHVERLQFYLQRELEIERDRLGEKIFDKTLEQIFIENRLYKKIENVASYDEIHSTIAASLEPFHQQLLRIPTYEDREKLLNIPIRRISRFDLEKNQAEIVQMNEQLVKINKDLKNIKKVAVNYIRALITKYGKNFPRKTQIQEIQQVDLRAIETRTIKVGFDPVAGFVGTKVVEGTFFHCTNFEKLLLIFNDGTYTVCNVPEKLYVHHKGKKVIYAGVADKKTVINTIYKDPKSLYCFVKRFIISKFILDKAYRYMEEGMTLEFLSTQVNPAVELQFIPKVNQKLSKTQVCLDQFLVKGVAAGGVKIANKQIKKVLAVKGSDKNSEPSA